MGIRDRVADIEVKLPERLWPYLLTSIPAIIDMGKELISKLQENRLKLMFQHYTPKKVL